MVYSVVYTLVSKWPVTGNRACLAKQTEIWDPETLLRQIWSTFCLKCQYIGYIYLSPSLTKVILTFKC